MRKVRDCTLRKARDAFYLCVLTVLGPDWNRPNGYRGS